MPGLKSEEGNRYGRLTVISLAGSDGRQQAHRVCRCDCGNQTCVKGSNLRRGRTQSCGCLQRENTSKSTRLSDEKRVRRATYSRVCTGCQTEKLPDAFPKKGHRCKSCMAAWQRQRKKNNPDRVREHCRRQLRRKKYGISPSAFNAILEAQGYQCAMCGAVHSNDNGQVLCVDHDHNTG
jgi:hypothetical protein